RPSQSRLPQPMNLERDRASQMGVTPMRGHHRMGRPQSVERPVALHSDKKWVSERALQILEYLHAAEHSQSAPGLSEDFYSRPGGLRQMTVKQFVGILNYFFHHIWRNRVTVGTNQVEDITGALQKLCYPHNVGKSWLLTPTTQHSFGHVITLLDFLMDFAPPLSSLSGHSERFPFMETAEQPSSYLHSMACESIAMSTTHAIQAIQLDEELNGILFAKSVECNVLWNEERTEEEAKLLSKIRDMVISRICNLPNREALEQETVGLRSQLADVIEQLQLPGAEKRLQHLEKLIQEQKLFQQQLLADQEELSQLQKDMEDGQAQGKQLQKELQIQTEYGQRLQKAVNAQKYTVQQVKALQIRHQDLTNESKVYERQVKELSDRENNQQVMLARAKHKLLDTIEGFNTHVRYISDSVVGKLLREGTEGNAGQLSPLLLPLQLQPEEIHERARLLGQLSHILQQQRQQNEEQRQLLEQQKTQLENRCYETDTEVSRLDTQWQANKQRLQKLEANYRSRRDVKRQNLEQLDKEHFQLAASVEQLQEQQQQGSAKLQDWKARSEELLSSAERKQEEMLQSRNAYLDDYERKLAEGERELEELNRTIAQTDCQLEHLRQEVQRTKLPSFDPVIRAMKRT
ncbi:hypothetical protein KR009_002925, partial [Drosophila setifemur]